MGVMGVVGVEEMLMKKKGEDWYMLMYSFCRWGHPSQIILLIRPFGSLYKHLKI